MENRVAKMGKSLLPRNRQRSALLLAVTLCAALLGGSSVAGRCDAGDQGALLAFKAQLDDPRNALRSWEASSDCCKWREITCNAVGRVSGLLVNNIFDVPDLPDGYQLRVKKGVQGPGASLGNLKELVELSLLSVGFGFAHPIPSQIGTLPKLTRLTIGRCEFIGGIPSSLGALTELQELSLFENRITGPAFPDSFSLLRALETLFLPDNALTSIGSQKITLLTNLETVDVSNNKISGPIPKWLGGLKLSGLSGVLSLSGNSFTGPIPGELCNIKGLQGLYIANTQVTSIPQQIGTCLELRVLVLVNNKLRGPLPPGLGELQKLQTLSLGSDSSNRNMLTCTLPVALGDLPDLDDFDIANNNFHGPIPANYGPFSGPFRVDPTLTRFQGNNLSGPIPKNLANFGADRFRPGNPKLCGAPLPACK